MQDNINWHQVAKDAIDSQNRALNESKELRKQLASTTNECNKAYQQIGALKNELNNMKKNSMFDFSNIINLVRNGECSLNISLYPLKNNAED